MSDESFWIGVGENGESFVRHVIGSNLLYVFAKAQKWNLAMSATSAEALPAMRAPRRADPHVEVVLDFAPPTWVTGVLPTFESLQPIQEVFAQCSSLAPLLALAQFYALREERRSIDNMLHQIAGYIYARAFS